MDQTPILKNKKKTFKK